tara:strand:- start:1080 stop:2444 length:1365 start_codon:yes stop_codon:yes gene_type:complete
MNKYIFREYDIRGRVDTDFNREVVTNLGKAFGTYVIRNGGQKVSISGDIRPSSPLLVKNFSNGLMESGIAVIDMGTLHTPANYFSMFLLDIDASVQVTGSHNPSEYNGFKLSLSKEAFYGEKILELKSIILNKDYEYGLGKIESYDILPEYHDMLTKKIKINKNLNVVMDCGNASACISAPNIFKKLGISVKELYCTVDGQFPNHHPDPTEDHNLVDLINQMKFDDYDFGVAYDGDADRVVVVDENGSIIRSDILMTLFLPEVIKNKGDYIIFDVKCSQALEDMVTQCGGIAKMWKTGHSLIKDKMKELKINFGGEMSGHIFFADDYYGYDDAIYVSLRLAQLLSKNNQRLSEMVAKVPNYYSTPEIRIECKNDEEKFIIADKAINYFSDKYDCITIDGVRIRFKDGWGLVRSSNTQPVIVCRFESVSKHRLDIIKNEILGKLSEFGEIKIDNK